MKTFTVWTKNESEVDILERVINEYSTSTGWFIRSEDRFPNTETRIFSITCLDEQSAFNFGFIYSRYLHTRYQNLKKDDHVKTN